MKRLSKWLFAAVIALAAAELLGSNPFFLKSAVADMVIPPDSPGLPVVVELFTSQGCNTCPPADELLGELAQQKGIIALEMHIDYWDYIGWVDPYAKPEITARQQGYARDLGLRYVYTPQMVIDGSDDAVGVRRWQVLDAIEDAAKRRKATTVTFAPGQPAQVTVAAGHAPEGGATIWLVTIDSQHETEVQRGENAGKRLVNYNVVREMSSLGTWDGSEVTIPIDLEAASASGRDSCAILVQQGRTGKILGAAMMDLPN